MVCKHVRNLYQARHPAVRSRPPRDRRPPTRSGERGQIDPFHDDKDFLKKAVTIGMIAAGRADPHTVGDFPNHTGSYRITAPFTPNGVPRAPRR
jgi:hypothetical protein